MPDAAGSAEWLATATVAEEIFELRPDYKALLVVALDLSPGPSDSASGSVLDAAEASARTALAGRRPEELEHVRQWREAYRSFGAKPQRTRPSVEALLRRLEPGLPRVDRITDVYNALSIAHLLPVGGEDFDAYVGAARLVRATGAESFETVRDGVPVREHPEPGEVVWRDAASITCRAWNWRQCTRTRLSTSTINALFIFDGLSPLEAKDLLTIGREFIETLGRLHPEATFSQRLIDGDA